MTGKWSGCRVGVNCDFRLTSQKCVTVRFEINKRIFGIVWKMAIQHFSSWILITNKGKTSANRKSFKFRFFRHFLNYFGCNYDKCGNDGSDVSVASVLTWRQTFSWNYWRSCDKIVALRVSFITLYMCSKANRIFEINTKTFLV